MNLTARTPSRFGTGTLGTDAPDEGGGIPSSLPLPLGQWWSAPGHRLSLVCSWSEIEGSSQLRSKRLGREGGEGAAL